MTEVEQSAISTLL